MTVVCPECSYPLVASTFRAGAICPAAWGECSRSGRVVA